MYFCYICIDKIDQPVYNLKKSKSTHSKIFLMSILEYIVGENILNFTHTINLNICTKCYEMLNQVDQFKIKLLETCNKLKYFISKKFEKDIPETIIKMSSPIKIVQDADGAYLKVENNFESNLSSISENNYDQIQDYRNIKESTNLIKEIVTSCKNLKNSDIEKDGCLIDTKIYKCNCSQQFNNLGDFQIHVKIHQNQNLKSYICEICGQSYKQKSSFNVHMKTHKDINPFTCSFCNKSFTQKISLMRHLPLHTGEKPHQCDECGKCFVHHTSFKVHKLIHTGLKTYKCEICEEYFRSSSHLKRHSKIHTGERKFQCILCGRKFAEKYNLVAHQKVHDTNKNMSLEKRNFSCQICAETFDRRHKLEEHKIGKHFITIS